jgi:hypothetical protein
MPQHHRQPPVRSWKRLGSGEVERGEKKAVADRRHR